MGSKKNKKQNGAGEEGKEMITDPRFASAHTDPRFRRIPRRESKVTIDSRFQNVFTDKDSAPVDKRGKRRRRDSGNASLKEFYRIEEEKKKKKQKEEESEDESESEEEEMKSKARGKRPVESSEGESEEEEEEEIEKLASSDEEDSEEDTDEEDEADFEEDGFEVLDENIANIDKETHRLAIVNMDWRYVSAKDLYVLLSSFLPKEGSLLSVAVYPTEFGLERMKEEEIHGPAIGGGKKNEDDEEDEEEDEEEMNRRARDYEKSRLKYYHGVAVCDSSATADFLYKSCDGVEFERSSNKLDLRFIPDSMEFRHPHRDIATEAPSNYGGLDFQSRALQMSKVDVSWDEDEPNRIKTLNQKFTSDQLADLEMMEYIASDSDDCESDDDNNDGANLSKEEKEREKYRSLLESGDVDSDEEEEEDNNQDMEVTFDTGLEELSKKFVKNKEEKSETLLEAQHRQRREKQKARKNKQKDDSSPDDDDDYNIDRRVANNDDNDDFFMEEPASKKKKEGKMKKKKSVSEEEVAAKEKSRANLELLLADGNAGDGNGLKGYNIKRTGKKRSKEIAELKTPEADLNDPRFASALSDPKYAVDPTDPQFKRSAAFKRQLVQKPKEDPRNHEEVKATATVEKEELNTDGNLVSKEKNLVLSSTLKSLQMKLRKNDSDEKKAGNAESLPTLAQRIKKKVKSLSNK